MPACRMSGLVCVIGRPDTYQIVHPGSEESLDWSSKIEGYCLRSKCSNSCRGRAGSGIAAGIFAGRFGREYNGKDTFNVSGIIEGHNPDATHPSWVEDVLHALAAHESTGGKGS